MFCLCSQQSFFLRIFSYQSVNIRMNRAIPPAGSWEVCTQCTLYNLRLTRGGIFQIGPPGRNEIDRKCAKMQKNGKSKTFVDKAPKLFLQRFMKQGLAEMEAVVVSFKMASSARMNIFVRTLNFQEYE